MRNRLNNPLTLISIGITLSIIFVILVYSVITSKDRLFTNNPEVIELTEHTETEEPADILGIIELKRVAPYSGKFFSFVFVENEGTFYVYIDPANKESGEKEFNDFLIQHGVSGKSNFPGLVELTEPTPAP